MRSLPSLLVGVVVLVFPSLTFGEVIKLSDLSSNGTDPALLDATLDFSVTGSALTLTVTNDTAAPNAFNINQLFFNAGSGATGLLVDSFPAGWSLMPNQSADDFGTFDFGLIDGVDQQPSTIAPGETVVFSFTILGSAVESDFTTKFSTLPPGNNPAIVAGKFVSGTGDDSAFGATIPEPASLGLLLAGALGAMRRRR